MTTIKPIDEELTFDRDELIVTKTDKTGRITYANDVFCRLAEMQNTDVVGQPHSIIRHPDMPRAVFKLLWDTIASGREIFAYVKNMSAHGRFYWVIAHITPSMDSDGNITGFHSNRRAPARSAVREIDAFYRQLRAIENAEGNRKEALAKSYAAFSAHVEAEAANYEQYIWQFGARNV